MLLILILILIFLNACSEETSVGSSEMHIYVDGTVTYKTNGSPAENVVVRFMTVTSNVLKTTTTDQEGKYSISYYGKCGTYDPGIHLTVTIMPPSGYKIVPPYRFYLECTSNIQTCNFQLEPLS